MDLELPTRSVVFFCTRGIRVNINNGFKLQIIFSNS
jgi:hypothetical protein